MTRRLAATIVSVQQAAGTPGSFLRLFPRFIAEWGRDFFFFFFWSRGANICFISSSEEMRDRKWRRISVSLFSRKAPVWFGQTMPNRRDQGRG